MTAHISASKALRRSGRLSRIHRLESTDSRTTLVVVEVGLLMGTPSVEVHGSARRGTREAGYGRGWGRRECLCAGKEPRHELYVIIVSIILARREVGECPIRTEFPNRQVLSGGEGAMITGRAPKAAMVVAQHIIRDATRQNLAAGDLLPSERVMLEKYEIGRGTLREALRLLEFQG